MSSDLELRAEGAVWREELVVMVAGDWYLERLSRECKSIRKPD